MSVAGTGKLFIMYIFCTYTKSNCRVQKCSRISLIDPRILRDYAPESTPTWLLHTIDITPRPARVVVAPGLHVQEHRPNISR